MPFTIYTLLLNQKRRFSYLISFRRLLNYTPPAVVIRLLTTNGLIAYITSWVLYLSGASSDPRLLLPAWISITTVSFPNHTSSECQFADRIILVDFDFLIPCYSEPCYDQT